MNDAYKEYVNEHPEELTNLNRIKNRSDSIHKMLRSRKQERLKKIEECRRILNGEHSE